MTNNSPKLGTISPLIPAGDDVEAAIAFYEEKLGFTATHTEGDPMKMAIVERDRATLFLIQNGDKHLAENTALRIEVEGIEQFYAEILAKDEKTVHPNGRLEVKPWGPKEFGVMDLAGVCITFYEFPQS
ncbi:MAG: glyoxalase superfamily protein [Cyanobacteriota bacterium]|nr:glyoxalase superfamily protein [Cyanobacteriota bacterium]